MYNKGDITYLTQPKIMSLTTLTATVSRIQSHISTNNLSEVFIVLHGGEPMLAGKKYIRNLINLFRNQLDARINFSIQTNGTLIDSEWVALFQELHVNLGISIDGPKQYHDNYRKYHNGKGSYDTIRRRLHNLNADSQVGYLFVVNTAILPEELYKFIKDMKIRHLNILLPDHHYADLPSSKTSKELGNWLISLYDLWRNDLNRPFVDFFENIIKSFFNLSEGTQILGSCENSVVCIETDGAIEVIDSLRTCKSGITKNNLNVSKNEIAEIFKLDLFKMYYLSHSTVADKCKKCIYLQTCGGGFLPHRYSLKNEFDNPSIYCESLFGLIRHIENDIKIEIKIE